MVEGEEDAHQVDKDPQEVQDVVPEEKEEAKLEKMNVKPEEGKWMLC